MRNKIFLSIVLFFTILLIGTASFATNWSKVYIEPSNTVKQGETAFITVQSEKPLDNPYILLNGEKIKMFKTDDNKYRGLIGIDALYKPGNYKFSIKDISSALKDEEYLFVVHEKFPIQNINVSAQTNSLAATSDELNKIQNAKSVESDIDYWSDRPFNSPVEGCVISTYGLTRYHNGKPTGDYHKGVDIKAPKGTAIRAITGGKVLIAQQFRLNGGTVAIDHGQGVLSFYLHMSKITVKPGQILSQNDKIGEVGATGFATGPHLHYGVYINGVPVNPIGQWIKPVPKC